MRLRTDCGEPEPLDLYVVYPTRRLLPERVRRAIEWLAQERNGPVAVGLDDGSDTR